MLNRRNFFSLTAGVAALPALSTLSCLASAQPKDLYRDVEIIRACMELHPGALRYLNPPALDSALDQFATEFQAEPNLSGQYLALSRFLHKLKCGHSYANFFNQQESVRAALFNRPTRLPFKFRWIGDAMVITDPGPDIKVPRGTIVSRINGIDAAQVLAALLPYTRADGAAPAKRRALLEVQDRSSIEFFDVFHGLVYGEPARGHHQLEITTPDGQSHVIEAPAIDLTERAERRNPGAAADGSLWSWQVDDGIAILTMPTWATYNSDWDWRAWLNNRMDEAVGLRGLVIDNRANEGGLFECGEVLMSRLIAKPVSVPAMRRTVRYRKVPETLRDYARTWDSSFYTIGENADALPGGFFELPTSQRSHKIQPAGQHVAIPTVLLTSPTNSSATFQFAELMRESGRGALVGEETGGNQRGINGDGFFFVNLPVSGLEFDLPVVGRFPSLPRPDAGIKPDIQVTDTVEDITVGRDSAMEQARALL